GHRLAALPARVRTVGGAVVDAEDAAVLDVPHARFTAERLVFGGLDVAGDLADTLDLPLAGDAPIEILGAGARFARGAHPGVTLAQALGALPDAAEVHVHDELLVAVDGTERRVPYVVVDGALHVQSNGW
ncbi:ATP-binding protein, partial [Tsukamurella pulmonis]